MTPLWRAIKITLPDSCLSTETISALHPRHVHNKWNPRWPYVTHAVEEGREESYVTCYSSWWKTQHLHLKKRTTETSWQLFWSAWYYGNSRFLSRSQSHGQQGMDTGNLQTSVESKTSSPLTPTSTHFPQTEQECLLHTTHGRPAILGCRSCSCMGKILEAFRRTGSSP